MKVPPIKSDESLAMWRARISDTFNLSDQLREIIREVSITSYIHGTNDVLDTLKKEGRI